MVNHNKKESSYCVKKNLTVFLHSMSFFILNSKRENRYYIFDILYNMILLYFYWEMIQIFHSLRFVIIFFDFFIKFTFFRGMIGNLKNLIYLPVQVRQKKIILFFLPLISLTNLPFVSILLNGEYSIFLFFLFNSYLVFNLKTIRKGIIFFLFFYSINGFTMFCLSDWEKFFLLFFIILTAFILITVKKLNHYLKLN